MADGAVIKVAGLKELRSALRKASDTFPSEIKEINFAVVNDILVPEAQHEAAAVTLTTWKGKSFHVNQQVIASIRALSQQRAAIIAMGGAKVPYAAGDEFGSMGGKSRKGKGHTTQFGGWKGNTTDAGYFLWPSIRAKSPEIQAKYLQLLDRMLAGPFPDKG